MKFNLLEVKSLSTNYKNFSGFKFDPSDLMESFPYCSFFNLVYNSIFKITGGNPLKLSSSKYYLSDPFSSRFHRRMKIFT